MSEPILTFFGPHRYLSNFFMRDFVWEHFLWQSSEHAYQAAKTITTPASRHYLAKIAGTSMSATEVKALGRELPCRSDWNEVKVEVMYSIVLAKFLQNPDLAAQLLATGDAHLEEGNTWNDRFWGVCPSGSGNGRNELGKVLMRVREMLNYSCSVVLQTKRQDGKD